MTEQEIQELARHRKVPSWVIKLVADAVAVEREACAKLCQDKAMRLETKAQEAIEAGEHGEVNAIRSTAFQISVCAAAIRARGNVREHTMSGDCWCNPELNYTDPETGAEVWVHKEPQ